MSHAHVYNNRVLANCDNFLTASVSPSAGVPGTFSVVASSPQHTVPISYTIPNPTRQTVVRLVCTVGTTTEREREKK